MAAASSETFLGAIENIPLIEAGETTRIVRQAKAYLARVQTADGVGREYPVNHVIGVAPLQQYLVGLPDGRMQMLGWSWDARSPREGGQRWFHLYAGLDARPGHPLHFLSAGQNWNSQCADCHVTGLRKNYEQAAKRYDTQWNELGVGCEGCHGPASSHLAWARNPSPALDKGLTWSPHDRMNAEWRREAGAPVAERHPRRESPAREIDVCARCHSHRSQFSENAPPGAPLLDAYLPSLLSPGLYWPTGAMRGEVYNHGSFLSSRMHQQGVTCSDCHLPHSAKLRVEGNGLCTQCHAPDVFDRREHHRHAQGEREAACTACHMPRATFMRIDPRHDHAFSVPRPDIAIRSGAPDACSSCHSDKPRTWVAEGARRLWPRLAARPAPFAEAMTAAHLGSEDASRLLRAIARDEALPPILKATALAELSNRGDAASLDDAARLLTHADPLVRHAAVEALATAPAAQRARLLAPMLDDPARAVRMAAARWLAGQPERQLPPAARTRLQGALAEYTAAQRYNADRPEAHNNLAAVAMDRGNLSGAAKALSDALALDADHVPSLLNSADLRRAANREQEAEAFIRQVLEREPRNALANHMLGLSLIRQKRSREALEALRMAAENAPGAPRYAYVYAVALDSVGETAAAVSLLRAAQVRHPGHRDIANALEAFSRKIR